MKNTKIAIIGCGNMGGAILKGLIAKGVASPEAISLYDKIQDKASALAKESACGAGCLSDVVSGAEYVILAVKPQDSASLLDEISKLVSCQTIISVMAGIRIGRIEEKLGPAVPVARAMPNMAAVIGESITCVSFNGLVKEKEGVKRIFSGIGSVVEVQEELMDAVTAVSGSGPAYLFYLAEAMINAAEDVGLDRDTALELVVQTLFGASSILRKTDGLSIGEMISSVASKGGTTEAALSVFEEKGLEETVISAVRKALERSRQLSEGK